MARRAKTDPMSSAPLGRVPTIDLKAAAECAKGWPTSRSRMRSVADLVPNARNARTHSSVQVDQIAQSIVEFGWTNPVLVRAEDATVIAGHGRVLAAERLGIRKIPTLEAVGWTDVQVRAYVIADNKLALNAGWDENILAAELSDLAELGFDMDLTGFSDAELRAFDVNYSELLTDPDDVPELQPKPVSRRGDVWICGAHRVVCGDSTSSDDLDHLMGKEKADACWTDPPYNVNYEGAAGKIENDNLAEEELGVFLLSALAAGFSVMKPGAPIYVAHADTSGHSFRAAFRAAGFKLSGCLVWAKDSLVLGRSDYQWQHEPLLYGWKPGAAHRWYGGRKETTVRKLEGSVFTTNEDGSLTVRVGEESLIVTGADLRVRPVEPTVLRIAKPRMSKEHPTMKPVELISRMLRNSTRKSDVVLDLFGGSGSTMICCEMLERAARLVELDPRFVDVIVRRWQQATGREAVRKADGQTFDLIATKSVDKGEL